MVVLADRYRRLALRRSLTRVDVWFLNQCINEHVTPTFARIRTSKNVPAELKVEMEHRIVRKEICKHYAKLDLLNLELKSTYDKISNTLSYDELQDFLNDVDDFVNFERQNKFQRVKNKLSTLIRNIINHGRNLARNNNKFSNFNFFNRIKNLSSTQFDDDEIELLRLGLKYSIGSQLSERDLLHFAIELDVIIENISGDSKIKNQLRDDVNFSLFKFKRHKNNFSITTQQNNFNSTLKNIKSKIKHDNLIVSKADKGNCLVILDRVEYVHKVESFLTENNFKNIETCPLNKFIKKTKTYIKVCDNLLKEFNAPKNLISSNPAMPRLYGLPKIHKDGIPIRPVVSYTNTPVSVISSFVYNLIKNLTNFKPSNSVSNTLDLTNKLKDINIQENYLMISFDVSNLFTSVPKNETIPLVGNLLRSKLVDESIVINILTLLNFSLSQDFFVFNEKFYQQPEGLAMGSCLSPFLADLFMDNLEINHILKNTEIKHYFRYVDDCFLLIEGNSDIANILLNKINTVHPSIKFTLEIENNQSLNFLDLTIVRSNTNLHFKIYRKPTQTDHVIHNTSNHPHQHKMAAFNCYVYRLLNIPMSELDYKNEVSILKQIAYNNGYDPKLIDSKINKIKTKLLKKEIYPQIDPGNSKFISIPFLNNNLSQQISKIFKSYKPDIKISHKIGSNLGKSLINSKDKIDNLHKSGVYKLSCSDCDTTYIGRTCRPLSVRINEHINNPNKSPFGHHIRFSQHNFNPERNSKLLVNVQSKNFMRLDFLEDLEINNELKQNTNCLNTQVNLNRTFIPIHRRLNSL